MDKHNELLGMMVLVHPYLANDPSGRKNQIGTIVSADLQNDNIVVGFNDSEHALFSADALLVLRNADDIQVDVQNDFAQLPFWEYGDIMDIMMLADSAQIEFKKAAIELSRTNPVGMEYTMQPLTDDPAYRQDRGFSR